MAFIDKLLEGGSPYGMEIEQPKAHDKINRLVIDNDIKNITQGLVMGLTGGGAGKGLRQLVLALKGKIKGGKMIPSQPIRKGTVGGPKASDFDKETGMLSKDFLKKEYSNMVETGEIDDILKSLQQSDRYVNYRPSFFQSLIDKFKKTF